MPLRIPIAKARYFWVYGINGSTNKGVVLGPFTSKEQAEEDASNLANVRVFSFSTRDQSRATRMIKAKVLKTGGARAALQRMRHGKGNVETREAEELFSDEEDDE